MWDAVKYELQLLCAKKNYCVGSSELEEALTIFAFAAVLVYGTIREIITRKLDGKGSELFVLTDDIFDIVLCRVFGVLLLSLVAATWTFYNDSAQVDVMIYEIVLALTALSVNNNKRGLLFVALSYSSWYGWFRLLMVTPLGQNYYVFVQPQWIAALLAFTSPMLAANLKYPALIDTNTARVAYGLVIFGVLVASNACFLLCDALAIYYDLIPNYAAKVSQGVYYRLFGMRMDSLTRMGYFAAMLVLQFITSKMPHLMLNEDALLEQLREQEATQEELRRQYQTQNKNATKKNGPTGQVKPVSQADVVHNLTDNAQPLEEADIDLTDIPNDCVEITAEAAIELQERLLRERNKS